jgi:hypothetical protein
MSGRLLARPVGHTVGRLVGRAALALALLATLGSAQAQRREVGYVSAGGGWSSLRTDCRLALSCDQVALGGRLLGGLVVVPGFAAEALLIDFGRARTRRQDGESTVQQQMLGLGTAVQLELGGGLLASFRGGLAASRVERSLQQSGRRSRESTLYLDGYGGFSLLFRMTRDVAVEIGFDATGVEDQVSRDSAALGFIGLSLRF